MNLHIPLAIFSRSVPATDAAKSISHVLTNDDAASTKMSNTFHSLNNIAIVSANVFMNATLTHSTNDSSFPVAAVYLIYLDTPENGDSNILIKNVESIDDIYSDIPAIYLNVDLASSDSCWLTTWFIYIEALADSNTLFNNDLSS
jgi:hypothetical protein